MSPEGDNIASEELCADDFYMDGPYLVFTAAYHLRRGFCCQSGCRHCPYPKDADEDGANNANRIAAQD